jgi:hypothetical protein
MLAGLAITTIHHPQHLLHYMADNMLCCAMFVMWCAAGRRVVDDSDDDEPAASYDAPTPSPAIARQVRYTGCLRCIGLVDAAGGSGMNKGCVCFAGFYVCQLSSAVYMPAAGGGCFLYVLSSTSATSAPC